MQWLSFQSTFLLRLKFHIMQITIKFIYCLIFYYLNLYYLIQMYYLNMLDFRYKYCTFARIISTQIAFLHK